MAVDLSQKTIERLFYNQIRDLTMKTCKLDIIDYQFSDRWQRFAL